MEAERARGSWTDCCDPVVPRLTSPKCVGWPNGSEKSGEWSAFALRVRNARRTRGSDEAEACGIRPGARRHRRPVGHRASRTRTRSSERSPSPLTATFARRKTSTSSLRRVRKRFARVSQMPLSSRTWRGDVHEGEIPSVVHGKLDGVRFDVFFPPCRSTGTGL